jgi:hypothetical protein
MLLMYYTGFNCGEAVNFAMGDWFPFGAAACLRYEFLNRVPLLPHEELLCKEAMTIFQQELLSFEGSDHEQRIFVKMAFLDLMRFQRKVHSSLIENGAKTETSSSTNVLCGLCKHICYLSYTLCKCYSEPTCLNHGIVIRMLS